jgi:F-type H+-transporting ATPase subunit b
VLFDPFTIIAQIVNFAILAFALKHFLYDRVIRAMDEREASIALRLAEADERKAAAAEEAESFRRRRRELDDRDAELLEEARATAERRRLRLLEEARNAVDDERRRWERALRAERDELHEELRRRAAREVVEVSRRALADLAGADLEHQALDRALDRLAADDEVRDELLGGADRADTVTVRTAFVLAEDDRARVTDRLRDIGRGEEWRVRFEHVPDLVLGVEFQRGGTAVGWHADDYLRRLGAAFEDLAVDPGDDDDD